MKKMFRIHFWTLALLLASLGIVSTIAYTQIRDDSINSTDWLLQSTDSSINNLHIKATSMLIQKKDFYNQSEQKREANLNRLHAIQSRSDKQNSAIVPYQAKVTNQDRTTSQSLDISFLNGKTRTFHDLENDLEDYIDFFEPEKLYTIRAADIHIEKKTVSILKSSERMNTFRTTGAHTFGRGLSIFTEYPKQLEKMENGLCKLTVFSTEQDLMFPLHSKFPEFTLDPNKGYCWTQGLFYDVDGKIATELIASDFRVMEQVWFPFHIETSVFHNGNEFVLQEILSIEEISPLPDTITELNVNHDIPSDAQFAQNAAS